MMKKLVLIFPLLLIGSCATLKDKGKYYFTKKTDALGIEPPEAFLERMNTDQKLRDIMYGQLKSAHIVQCTLLRNQVYVASMKDSDKEIEQAVKLLEPAYQENDQAFLAACDQVLGTKVGKAFLEVQNEYLGK